jgi:hypothetical protein
MQKRKTAAITDCDRDTFARRADRNAVANPRRNTNCNSIANADGTDTNSVAETVANLSQSREQRAPP